MNENLRKIIETFKTLKENETELNPAELVVEVFISLKEAGLTDETAAKLSEIISENYYKQKYVECFDGILAVLENVNMDMEHSNDD